MLKEPWFKYYGSFTLKISVLFKLNTGTVTDLFSH